MKKRKLQQQHEQQQQQHLRIAIDISSWIASACHGNGAELLDERHFTRYGRAAMLREQKEVPLASAAVTVSCTERSSTKGALANNGNHNVATNTTNDDIEVEKIQNFIKRATDSVMRKISSVLNCLSTEIIIVFDGDTPPIKKKCCQQRQKVRNDAASNRDHIFESSFRQDQQQQDQQPPQQQQQHEQH